MTRASQQQADALAGVFSGQKGAPMSALASLVGKVPGVERASVEFKDSGRRHSARIGDGIEIEVEDFVPEGLAGPIQLENVFHPSNTTLTVAKPTTSRIAAFGMTFEIEGPLSLLGAVRVECLNKPR